MLSPKIHLITLGVSNLKRSRDFYETGLDWPVSSASTDSIVFLRTQGAILALFPLKELHKDAEIQSNPAPQTPQFSLAHNCTSPEAVDQAMESALKAGARLVKKTQSVFWGGYSGYFSDPDGFLWELAWNPFFPFDENENLNLPK